MNKTPSVVRLKSDVIVAYAKIIVPENFCVFREDLRTDYIYSAV